jgi:hypothetical protein
VHVIVFRDCLQHSSVCCCLPLCLECSIILQYPLTAVVDHFLPLSVTAVTFAFVASTLLYMRSRFCRNDELTPGGNTGMSTIINQIFKTAEENDSRTLTTLLLACKCRFGN